MAMPKKLDPVLKQALVEGARIRARNTDTRTPKEKVGAYHRNWTNEQAAEGLLRKSIRAPIAAMAVIERLADKVLAGEPLEQVLLELAPKPSLPGWPGNYYDELPLHVLDAINAGDPAALWLRQQLDSLDARHRSVLAKGKYLAHKVDVVRAYEDAGRRLYKLRGVIRRRTFYAVGLTPKDRLPTLPADVLRELGAKSEMGDGYISTQA